MNAVSRLLVAVALVAACALPPVLMPAGDVVIVRDGAGATPATSPR